MARIQSFEDLDVWKQGREVRPQFYDLASRLPDHERYNLAGQIRRPAVSLTANIAEGYGRFHFKENVQFCRTARGSAFELLDHLITCHDEGYLAEAEYVALRKELSRIAQLLNGYIRSIGKKGVQVTARGRLDTNDK